MGKILEVAEALWTGKTSVAIHHPSGRPWGMEKLTNQTWMYKGFANTIVHQTSEGLIIIDPAAGFDIVQKYKSIREVTDQPLRVAVFTHGHEDHVCGVPLYLKEAREKAWPPPIVIAHEATIARLQRYRMTEGWNNYVNKLRFLDIDKTDFPADFHHPDHTYQNRMEITLGGSRAQLRHARGETEDHTWVFFNDERLLCTGDLFIWALPGAGNPHEAQSFVEDWAAALREMAALKPKYMVPGHGFPIIGVKRVTQALSSAAAILETLFKHTLTMMNQGASLDAIVNSIKIPKRLREKPYLQPVYDEPEFIVRNIWRSIGGWHDRIASHLKPASEPEQAKEIAGLAGGSQKLVERAKKLAKKGDYRMACRLGEWAVKADPENPSIRETASKIFHNRANDEKSTIAADIFRAYARELEKTIKKDQK